MEMQVVEFTVNDTVSDTVNDTAKAIYLAIKNNPNVTIEELMPIVGKSRSTVTRNLRALKEKGLSKRVGSDKTGYWRIK